MPQQAYVWRQARRASTRLCPPYSPVTQNFSVGNLAQHRLRRAVPGGIGTLFVRLEVRLHIGAEVAGARDDAVAGRAARGFELSQRRIDIAAAREQIGEHDRILGGLGDAGADMRARHEGGIAEQRDAPECHLRHREIVDRLQERLRAQRQHFGELRREHFAARAAHPRNDIARAISGGGIESAWVRLGLSRLTGAAARSLRPPGGTRQRL